MTPKECFEKWDAQYLVTIHVRLKNGESEDIPSYWK